MSRCNTAKQSTPSPRRAASAALALVLLISAGLPATVDAHYRGWGGGGRYYGYGPSWRYGGVIRVLPAVATVVTVGALSYWYADGLYYRSAPGGYQVVPAPVLVDGGTPSAPAGAAALPKLFVYPRQGQTAQQQASDEFECHQWAVAQTGFDPAVAAAGGATASARRPDYARAQSACLDGRGYTVR